MWRTGRKTVNVAVIGVGNCASALIQGLTYYRRLNGGQTSGLMHDDLGGYKPSDIKIKAAFDIDQRKIGRDVSEAIFALPNCTAVFEPNVPRQNVEVQMGCVVDGYSRHMDEYPVDRRCLLADAPQPKKADVVRVLRDADVDVMVNYLPVGSQRATEFYAMCALEAGVAFVNNIPVFIASDPFWAGRFKKAGLPIIGDDIKSQLGATILHRVLTELFAKRGATLDRTYQLNTGGNTDFLNMKNQTRLVSKKISKTEAVQAVAQHRLSDENIHVGPSDYVPWQKDNKVCYLRMEGRLFGSVPMNLEVRLSVEDSPNSAGVAIDMIRCAKLALDRGVAGVLEGPSAFYCKHPLVQHSDEAAWQMTEAFIAGSRPVAAKDRVPGRAVNHVDDLEEARSSVGN